MKTITAEQFAGVIEGIVHDREELAKLRKEPFVGVNQGDVLVEIKNRLGDKWILKKNPTFKLKKEDIPAMANARFYRKTGMKMLMMWAMVILAFAILTLTLRLIPLQVYYGCGILITAGFVCMYSRKQKRVREELKQELRDAGILVE